MENPSFITLGEQRHIIHVGINTRKGMKNWKLFDFVMMLYAGTECSVDAVSRHQTTKDTTKKWYLISIKMNVSLNLSLLSSFWMLSIWLHKRTLFKGSDGYPKVQTGSQNGSNYNCVYSFDVWLVSRYLPRKDRYTLRENVLKALLVSLSGVYDFTNMAVFENWDIKTALMDTVGGILPHIHLCLSDVDREIWFLPLKKILGNSNNDHRKLPHTTNWKRT